MSGEMLDTALDLTSGRVANACDVIRTAAMGMGFPTSSWISPRRALPGNTDPPAGAFALGSGSSPGCDGPEVTCWVAEPVRFEALGLVEAMRIGQT